MEPCQIHARLGHQGRQRFQCRPIDVQGVDLGVTVGEAVLAAAQSSHLRQPVFEGRVGRLVGILNTLKLLGKPVDAPIRPYVKPVRHVPGSKSIRHLLLELRRDGDVVAVVADEFGASEGIVTIEDIMEEVAEETEDEYDAETKFDQWIHKVGANA